MVSKREKSMFLIKWASADYCLPFSLIEVVQGLLNLPLSGNIDNLVKQTPHAND